MKHLLSTNFNIVSARVFSVALNVIRIVLLFFVSISSTNWTTSFLSLYFWWQKMSVYAMGFSGVYGRSRVTAKGVLARQRQSKMIWITTPAVVANNVIYRLNFRALSLWNRAVLPRIYQAMNFLAVSIKRYNSISALINLACPIPASSFDVNGYFRGNTNYVFRT